MVFERRGGGVGETSPYKQIFQIPAPGEFGEIGACKGTQAVLVIIVSNESLLVRMTRGCHWNTYYFCGLYKSMNFSMRPIEDTI